MYHPEPVTGQRTEWARYEPREEGEEWIAVLLGPDALGDEDEDDYVGGNGTSPPASHR